MKRIFVAVKVEPGEILLSMISSLKTGLINEKINWTNPDNIHITLAFLGDTEERKIKPLGEALKGKIEALGKFKFIIRGSGIFKNLNDPRVIWAGIESSAELVVLNEVVMRGLRSIGTKIDDRPFSPHLTLGRIKHLDDKANLKSLTEKYQNLEIQKVPVNEVILYESILLQSSPVYNPLTKFYLK
jgi:RNA 2',3'-cyclic 3'-phosphodiesterase